jgi:prevent-host-death family protein
VKEITATDATRHFSRLLDEIERDAVSFTVTRRGRPVAAFGPVKPRSLTVAQLLERLRGAPRPDAGFAPDVEQARHALGAMPQDDAWGR